VCKFRANAVIKFVVFTLYDVMGMYHPANLPTTSSTMNAILPPMNATHEHHLAELEAFFADAKVCRDCSPLLEHLSIRLAALGYAAQVQAMVVQSPETGLFAALSHGLLLYLGQSVENAADRAVEIATQIGRAITEFACDQEAAALEFASDQAVAPAEEESGIDYGFVQAAMSAA
jgi:hypothetical protein